VKQIDPHNIHRVLLVRPSALGDVCRTVPIAVSVKRALPHCRLDWLVQEGFQPAIAHHPDVDHVVSFPRRRLGWRALTRRRSSRSLLRQLLRQLRPAGSGRYDAVLDCQGLLRSAMFARWTGAGIRLGDRRAREAAPIFYTHRVDTRGLTHTVDRMLAIVKPLTGEPTRDLRLYTSEAARAAARRLIGDQPFVVVAPTSRWPGKRWPAERYASVIAELLAARDAGGEPVSSRVVIVAASGEREQCAAIFERFAGEPRVLDLVGATSVGELMAIIELSSLVLANDSAALHMAVGFDRPLVGLFGPTRIDEVGPYGRRDDVLQATAPAAGVSHKFAAAGERMMSAIDTHSVVEALLSRLHNARTHAASTSSTDVDRRSTTDTSSADRGAEVTSP
jgi:lipopolysaccharide heptosyltransferase I